MATKVRVATPNNAITGSVVALRPCLTHRCRPRPGGTETNHAFRRFRQTMDRAMMIDPSAKLLAVLDRAEEYRGLAIRAKDQGERETYECIVELYVEIAEELERLTGR
jgi:hypothetical protein